MADMTNVCTTCRFASWDKTASGRLHPSGDGRCTWEVPSINLPIAFYFVGSVDRHNIPQPSGGSINRKRLKPCPAWNLKAPHD
jgi:hypothetical protein